MNKRQFVGNMLIRVRPDAGDVPKVVAYAETVYAAWMGCPGYGRKPGEPKPRESINYYARLNEPQKAGFDRFWKDYGYKEDKQDAAHAWMALWAEIEPILEHVLAAARHAAKIWRETPPTGLTRLYAVRWLTKRRWDDYQPPSEAKGQVSEAVQRSRLVNELNSLRQLHARGPSETLARKIRELEERLRIVGG